MNECPKWRISSVGCVIYTFFRNCIMVVVTITTALVMIMFMDMMMIIVIIIKS